jgi:hypothetical protein
MEPESHHDTEKLMPNELWRARSFLEHAGYLDVQTYTDQEVEEEIEKLMDIETFRAEGLFKQFT